MHYSGWALCCYSARNQRNNSDMPVSTNAKNKAMKIHVERTTIVYRVSSLRLGQLTFLISETTFLKKSPIFPIVQKPPKFKNHSISFGILLNSYRLFMHGMPIAMSTEFIKFQTCAGFRSYWNRIIAGCTFRAA